MKQDETGRNGKKPRRRWIKKILNVNIINFEKVDKPKGGVQTKWIRFLCEI